MPLVDSQIQTRNRVAFRTIGCRLNQCETAQMQEAVVAGGYRLVDWDEPADIRVVNTCTVTAKSDRTCRHEIRAAKRRDPECMIAVTGCYAQVAPEVVAAIPGVDLVLGNRDKLRLAEWLGGRALVDRPKGDGAAAGPPDGGGTAGGDAHHDGAGAAVAGGPAGAGRPGECPAADNRPAAERPVIAVSPHRDEPGFEGEFFSHFYGYTRAFLKVQTGCDSRCAYCIVPLARGPARSMPWAEVLEQVQLLVSRDYREVVLTGINLGSWGRDTGEGSIADLLALLLERGGAGRYRLSSLEPLDVDEELQDVIVQAGDRVAHHFHLPLQSGADPVLERMGRPYTAAQYLAAVTELACRFPDAALGADVIVGFPGETEQEFEETLAFVEHSPLTYLHVFAYSDRPGTKASALGPKIRPEIIQERSMRLRALGERKKAAFRGRLAGTEQRVLILGEVSPDGLPVGLTGNYQEVLVDVSGAPVSGTAKSGAGAPANRDPASAAGINSAAASDALVNRFVRVRLLHPRPDGYWEAEVLRLEDREGSGSRNGSENSNSSEDGDR
jgi:threonylcarbamoyladenosine tRNA methylthiotransferase MtaB